ncbi:UbiA family prenyltransferase [Fibrella aquatilis]|uniref:UbiA family prenyltransferase n=1 Tax=Fibrella aquatilis TaxID=2817059 RepID=A0A939G7D2_9BACT|nr:UbiA family prenyltransferase [Fibrella aquatilis]MBO0933777.1 UbiA family prenyltransferase [Fibrella aquatilis]
MRVANLLAYLNERFPVVNMALFGVLFMTVYSVACFFYPALAASPIGWREGWGIVAVISFFFRLRVFDEQKDYALDAINHPHRVLQSGRVSLRQLVAIAWVGALLELAWSVLMGLPTVLAWAVAVGYSLLMRYEFFAPHYLKKRLVLYAFTHMLIMPAIIGWVWAAYVPSQVFTYPFFLLALLSLLGGFSFEIARKLHAPDAEKAGIDSYSKAIGYAAAIGAVLLLLLVSLGVQYALLTALEATWPSFLLIGLLFVTTLVVYFLALRTPRERLLKRAELLVSLAMLVSYLAIIGVSYLGR